jgi:hypothetical protein
MSESRTPVQEDIPRVAALRAAGECWEEIALKLGLDLDELQTLPHRFCRSWKRAYRIAEETLEMETSAEAHFSLRQLLRSEDEKSRLASLGLIIRLHVENQRFALESRPARRRS